VTAVRIIAAVIAALALAACSGADPAPDIAVADALVRTPNPARDVTAGYMTLANRGGADRLVGASSPAADRIELHTHSMDDGVMRMRQVEAVDLPAGETVRFEPGGLHLMIFGAGALQPGDMLVINLDFETAADRAVSFTVGDPAL